jgi:hypothetical protein
MLNPTMLSACVDELDKIAMALNAEEKVQHRKWQQEYGKYDAMSGKGTMSDEQKAAHRGITDRLKAYQDKKMGKTDFIPDWAKAPGTGGDPSPPKAKQPTADRGRGSSVWDDLDEIFRRTQARARAGGYGSAGSSGGAGGYYSSAGASPGAGGYGSAGRADDAARDAARARGRARWDADFDEAVRKAREAGEAARAQWAAGFDERSKAHWAKYDAEVAADDAARSAQRAASARGAMKAVGTVIGGLGGLSAAMYGYGKWKDRKDHKKGRAA